jgi:hypothetical protein
VAPADLGIEQHEIALAGATDDERAQAFDRPSRSALENLQLDVHRCNGVRTADTSQARRCREDRKGRQRGDDLDRPDAQNGIAHDLCH